MRSSCQEIIEINYYLLWFFLSKLNTFISPLLQHIMICQSYFAQLNYCCSEIQIIPPLSVVFTPSKAYAITVVQVTGKNTLENLLIHI